MRWSRLAHSCVSYEGLRNAARGSGTGWFETPQYLQSAGPANSLARRMLSFPGQTPISGGAISMTCAQLGLVSTQCRDTANGLDLGSPLTTPLGTPDPTWGQPGTPFGIGNGFDGIPDVMRIQTLTPTNDVNAQYNVRIDFHPTEKDLIAYSIYRVPTVRHSINGPARDLNRWNSERLSQSWTGIWTRTFSPTLLNEARFGASGWKFDDLESNPQEPWGLPVSRFDSPGIEGVFDSFDGPAHGVALIEAANRHISRIVIDVLRSLPEQTDGRPGFRMAAQGSNPE